ncbi:MAG: cytochrome c [Bdellovibrionales bacterium]|nr:cytochrome c [Bdellovibrionales bacterium]
MKNRLSLVLALMLLCGGVQAFDPVEYFDKKCSSCHTIGGGDDVGPDLKGVTERRDQKWMMRFIRESQTVINAGDPIAVELFNKYRKKKMPDQDLSDEDVLALLDFIKSGGQGLEKAIASKSALEATGDEIHRGGQLFSGEVALAAGGPACIQCHSAGSAGPLGGGTLGPDLTQSYSNYNDQGLSKVLTKIAFPVMDQVYAGKALTEAEVYQLKSFLLKMDREGPAGKGAQKKFVFLGLIGLFLGFGAIDLSWRNRRRKSSRPTIGESE